MTGNPEVDYANLLESLVFGKFVLTRPRGAKLLKTPFSGKSIVVKQGLKL